MSDQAVKKYIGFSKLDVAKRQLETAIRLFFNQGDPVSIHTLVAASHEVLHVFGKSHQVKSVIWPLWLGHVSEALRKKYHSKVREAQRFFKHGSRDKDEILKFKPEFNEMFILDACMMYEALTQEKTPLIQLFYIWHVAKYPEIWKDTEFSQAVKDITAYLPPNPSKSSYLSLLPEIEKTMLYYPQGIVKEG